MKYAIGEIAFLGLRFGIGLRPGTPEPRTAAESRAKLAMKYAIGKNCFLVLRSGAARAMGSEAVPATRSFPRPCRGTMLEASHERFDWPKIS